MMIKKLTIHSTAMLGLLALLIPSCGPNAQRGATLGALGGAAVGGIVGHQSGRGLEGAAIGGALGAAGGAAVGDARDQEVYGNPRGRYGPNQPMNKYEREAYETGYNDARRGRDYDRRSMPRDERAAYDAGYAEGSGESRGYSRSGRIY